MTNQDNQVNLWWRPLKFKTVEELQTKINEYFNSCFELQWKDEIARDNEWNKLEDKHWKWIYKPKKIKVMVKIPTITGLAVALNTSRRTLIDYEDMKNQSEYKEEFSHAIKGAKDFIESLVEEWALMNTLNPTSAIFNLKNNFDWKEKTEVDNNLNWNINIWTILNEIQWMK